MSEKIEVPVMLLAFVNGGWCIVDKDMNVLQGPYDNFEDARNYLEIRAYRLAKGWVP